MNLRKDIVLIISLALAFICILLGFFTFFFWSQTKLFDNNLIGALSSLAGVFVFAAALVYQIREYHLQIEELKKSVDAQTRTSVALDEQKKIMLEQSTNSLVFEVFSNFNTFKSRDEIQHAISQFKQDFQLNLNATILASYQDIQNNEEGLVYNETALAQDLKKAFENSLKGGKVLEPLTNFKNFSVNIVGLIYTVKSNSSSENWLSSFYHNQYTTDEKLVLYLLNTFIQDTGQCSKLDWHFTLTESLLRTYLYRNKVFQSAQIDVYKFLQELNKFIPSEKKT
jgi:hypothetical protein